MLKLTGVQLHKLAGDVADLVNMADGVALQPVASSGNLDPMSELA